MIAALLAHLEAHAGLRNLVDTRIYPQILPQNGTLPAIVYQLISRTGADTRAEAAGLVVTRWQFTANARTYAAAVAIMTQLKAALQSFTSSDPRVDHLFLDNEREDNEPEFDENNYFRRMIDILVWHEE